MSGKALKGGGTGEMMVVEREEWNKVRRKSVLAPKRALKRPKARALNAYVSALKSAQIGSKLVEKRAKQYKGENLLGYDVAIEDQD